MEKIKLIIPEGDKKVLPLVRDLRLNLNGRKPRRVKNLYKQRLNQIRRLLR